MGSDGDLSEGTTFLEFSQRLVDEYLVPEGPVRDLLLHFGALLGGDLTGLELAVISSVCRHLHDEVREAYRPRSPLEAQLECQRATKDLQAMGIRSARWTDSDTAFVAERWERWQASGDTADPECQRPIDRGRSATERPDQSRSHPAALRGRGVGYRRPSQ